MFFFSVIGAIQIRDDDDDDDDDHEAVKRLLYEDAKLFGRFSQNSAESRQMVVRIAKFRLGSGLELELGGAARYFTTLGCVGGAELYSVTLAMFDTVFV